MLLLLIIIISSILTPENLSNYELLGILCIKFYYLEDDYGARVIPKPNGFNSSINIKCFNMYNILIIFSKGCNKRNFFGWQKLWIVGMASYIAYAIAAWAFMYLSIAIISSLRETAIIFALPLSFFFLKEKLDII